MAEQSECVRFGGRRYRSLIQERIGVRLPFRSRFGVENERAIRPVIVLVKDSGQRVQNLLDSKIVVIPRLREVSARLINMQKVYYSRRRFRKRENHKRRILVPGKNHSGICCAG